VFSKALIDAYILGESNLKRLLPFTTRKLFLIETISISFYLFVFVYLFILIEAMNENTLEKLR
jgi:hypothetical protein